MLPKKLSNFVATTLGEGFSITPLTFTHAASGQKDKRKGYAIYGPSSNPFSSNKIEYFTFEPCYYSNGDKWLIYGDYFRRYAGLTYAKNISEAINKVKKACCYK